MNQQVTGDSMPISVSGKRAIRYTVIRLQTTHLDARDTPAKLENFLCDIDADLYQRHVVGK